MRMSIFGRSSKPKKSRSSHDEATTSRHHSSEKSRKSRNFSQAILDDEPKSAVKMTSDYDPKAASGSPRSTKIRGKSKKRSNEFELRKRRSSGYELSNLIMKSKKRDRERELRKRRSTEHEISTLLTNTRHLLSSRPKSKTRDKIKKESKDEEPSTSAKVMNPFAQSEEEHETLKEEYDANKSDMPRSHRWASLKRTINLTAIEPVELFSKEAPKEEELSKFIKKIESQAISKYKLQPKAAPSPQKTRNSQITRYVTVVDTTITAAPKKRRVTVSTIPSIRNRRTNCRVCKNPLSSVNYPSSIDPKMTGSRVNLTKLSQGSIPKLDEEEMRLYFISLTHFENTLLYKKYKYMEFQSFILRWEFLRYSDEFSFNLNANENKCNLDMYKNYFFKINRSNYLYLLQCPMPIELFVAYENKEKLIGKADLKFAEGLKTINKFFDVHLEMDNYELCLCFKDMVPSFLGNLFCRFLFKGRQTDFDKCIPPPRQITVLKPMGDGGFGSLLDTRRLSTPLHPRKSNLSSVYLDPDFESFQDGFNMVLIRNKALKTTRAEITQELKERTKWMHEELKWRLTLQENAILSGNDPNDVKWRQWKDETTATIKYRTQTDIESPGANRAVFTIDIVSLSLFKESPIIDDDAITKIYIEHNFLGRTGIVVETISIPKQDDYPLLYNHKSTFVINSQDKDASILANMIKNKESIVFNVVSQPEELPTVTQTCKDIAQCQVELFTLINSRKNTVNGVYVVADEYKPDIQLGTLTITFTGVLEIRSLALKMLTPESFKILK